MMRKIRTYFASKMVCGVRNVQPVSAERRKSLDPKFSRGEKSAQIWIFVMEQSRGPVTYFPRPKIPFGRSWKLFFFWIWGRFLERGPKTEGDWPIVLFF